VSITVHAGSPSGPAGLELIGFDWNTASLDGVAPLAPRTVRIDASLEEASSGPDSLDLTDLLARVAAVRAVGAEPIVILSYMPEWLGAPEAHGRDFRRVPPADPEAWEGLIETVVHTLATAPAPAFRFEVWNEPDNPIFWQDLPTAFVDMAVRTHRAVAAVATDTGLALQVGGPATLVPDPVFVVPYVNAMKSNYLPLDFLSWHYYGNTPFFGPDGAEDLLPPELLPLYTVLGRPNPLTSPSVYSGQVEFMRALRDALVTGSDLHPILTIDEWNLSAGGFDNRHDTNEGAAFVAGALIEMERSGLDESDFYRAAATVDPAHTGDWGIVDAAGQRKPSWSVFDMWNRAGDTRLVTEGDDPRSGLWARGSSDGTSLNVLLASWDPRGGTDRTATVHVGSGCSGKAEVHTIDSQSPSFDATVPVPVTEGAVTVDLSSQSVVWLSVPLACATAAIATGERTLAETGSSGAVGGVLVLLVVVLAVRRVVGGATFVELEGEGAAT
jgi:hypothetical protein